MEASKFEIKSLQGLCVLAMICLHLFCRTDFTYSPAFYIAGIPLCYYFGQLGDFCVMGFAFCSAYGHSAILEKSSDSYYRGRIRSLLNLLIRYWCILIVFSLVSICVGNGMKIPGGGYEFLGNFFLYKLTYNGAWWYLTTYIFLTLTSKLIIKFIYKHHYLMIIFLSVIVYTGSYYVRFFCPQPFESSIINEIVKQVYLYGMAVAEYCIGVLFYKYRIFSKSDRFIDKIGKWKYCVGIFAACSLLLSHTLVERSLFVAPAIGMLLILLHHWFCRKNRFLHWIGMHSTNMWLTHMFFYQVLFVDFIFVFQYPVLIFAAMVMITVLVSFGLKRVQFPLIKMVNRLLENHRSI